MVVKWGNKISISECRTKVGPVFLCYFSCNGFFVLSTVSGEHMVIYLCSEAIVYSN